MSDRDSTLPYARSWAQDRPNPDASLQNSFCSFSYLTLPFLKPNSSALRERNSEPAPPLHELTDHNGRQRLADTG